MINEGKVRTNAGKDMLMRTEVKIDKKKKRLKIVVAVILILGVLALAFKFVLYDKIKEKAFDMVTKDVVQQMIDENPQLTDNTDVSSIIDSISEEDKAKVEKMIADSVSIADAPKVLKMVKKGNVQGLKEYARDNFTEDQLTEMKEIYQKYVK